MTHPDFLFAPASPGNPFQQAKLKLMAELARMPVPRIDVTPDPEQIDAVGDFVRAFAKHADFFMGAVGLEVRANVSIDLKDFESPFTDAVEGWALHDLTVAAERLRAEYESGDEDAEDVA